MSDVDAVQARPTEHLVFFFSGHAGDNGIALSDGLLRQCPVVGAFRERAPQSQEHEVIGEADVVCMVPRAHELTIDVPVGTRNRRSVPTSVVSTITTGLNRLPLGPRVHGSASRSARRSGHDMGTGRVSFNRCLPLFRDSQFLAISRAIASVAALLERRVGFIRRAAVVEVEA